uniref:Methyltransferase type 11 domain-containing protein n=1 Tax=Ditylenchus dipsaci TaxID=166011 RepID=A0A915EAN1_9BILA
MKQNQIANTGTYKKVDIIASGDKLPFATNSQDFVLSSHVIEHFYDPVKTIKEWLRVVKPGGYVFIVVPHKERTFDRERNRTTLAELIHRHEHPTVGAVYEHSNHYSVWITQDFVELCKHYKWKVVATQDVDDKLGIGFTVVLQKE